MKNKNAEQPNRMVPSDDDLPVTQEEISMVKKVRKLHKRGSDAVVKCKKGGELVVYEVMRHAV